LQTAFLSRQLGNKLREGDHAPIAPVSKGLPASFAFAISCARLSRNSQDNVHATNHTMIAVNVNTSQAYQVLVTL